MYPFCEKPERSRLHNSEKLTMVPLKTKMSMQPYQLITRYIHDLPEREREKKKTSPFDHII